MTEDVSPTEGYFMFLFFLLLCFLLAASLLRCFSASPFSASLLSFFVCFSSLNKPNETRKHYTMP